jgi:hypothetical protein
MRVMPTACPIRGFCGTYQFINSSQRNSSHCKAASMPGAMHVTDACASDCPTHASNVDPSARAPLRSQADQSVKFFVTGQRSRLA